MFRGLYAVGLGALSTRGGLGVGGGETTEGGETGSWRALTAEGGVQLIPRAFLSIQSLTLFPGTCSQPTW